ncbi:MAG TPA: PepSY domain-containing protein [Planctomycetota bacterium]|nr:PepSY domain-containing protein [Planctomycetota bacterium]
MKALAFLLVGVLAGPLGDPDYAKLLEMAKISLTEAIAKASKEVPGGTPVSAYVEDNEGKPRFFLYVAKDTKTVEIAMDLKDGTVTQKETLNEDDSKLVSATKISLAKAIETALKKVPGKAVYADFDLDEKGPVEAEVDVFAAGKVTKVYINAVTGDVIKTENKP